MGYKLSFRVCGRLGKKYLEDWRGGGEIYQNAQYTPLRVQGIQLKDSDRRTRRGFTGSINVSETLETSKTAWKDIFYSNSN